MNECRDCQSWAGTEGQWLGECSFWQLKTPCDFSCAFFEPREGESAVSRARDAINQATVIDEYTSERLSKNGPK